MKQILQNIANGETTVVDVPCPSNKKDSLLIASRNSLVSAGTERMLIDFGKANYIDKARQQPDKVKMVLNKVKTDGLLPTIEAVRSKLSQPIPLGYCNVGVVLESGVEGFVEGDRVVSNGNHAEVVCVPKNLCVKVPDGVDDESAAFTVLAAVGLQGIRLVKPTLGETIVVSGLGLVGLLTVQLLIANGCRVLGVDSDSSRCAMAGQFGAEIVDLSKGMDPIVVAQDFSRGRGVDAVIVAAATNSDEVMHQAAQMCRKRGRVVLVGVVGLNLRRDDFFKKEISFCISASYGPGRYDSNYEDKGQDYPFGFVRWTEQRNFEAVLDMMADGRLDVNFLISHRFSIGEAEKAYKVVTGIEPSLGIILDYPECKASSVSKRVEFSPVRQHDVPSGLDKCGVSFVGAGNYATAVLIPAFKDTGVRLHCVASSGGVSGVYAGRKFGFAETSTDTDALFSEKETNAVVISTRHDSHAHFVLKALETGKHIFVEKPLCLTLEELSLIEREYFERCGHNSSSLLLMVGFNRRFSPQVQKMKELLDGVTGPKSLVMTVNAGMITEDHWTQDRGVGGGRVVGEACHFIDLLRFLVGFSISGWQKSVMDTPTGDTLSIQLSFEDGSLGTVHYFANGSKSFPKERLEIFTSGRVLQLDNFRKLTGFGWPNFSKMNLWRQDKGQKTCASAFVKAIEQGAEAPIPLAEVFEVSRVAIEVAQI